MLIFVGGRSSQYLWLIAVVSHSKYAWLTFNFLVSLVTILNLQHQFLYGQNKKVQLVGFFFFVLFCFCFLLRGGGVVFFLFLVGFFLGGGGGVWFIC